MDDITSQFKFPQNALINGAGDFLAKGITARPLNATGVNDYQMAGHEKGIGFRFFIHPVKNEEQSAGVNMEINDEIEMIEWFVTQDHKPVERVHMLPEQLLRFAKQKKDGKVSFVRPLDCIGGKFKDAYLTWKAGLDGVTGLSLSRWDKMSIGQVASLNSAGIFTVQQFASMERNRTLTMPKVFQELFEDAIQFVNAQKPLQDVQKYAEEIVSLKHEKHQQDEVIKSLQERLLALETKPTVEVTQTKKKGMPKGGWPSMQKNKTESNKEIITDGDSI